MTLKSMTGFARSDGSHQTVNWHWEVRTLNGRGLDIRLRLPSGYEFLDQPVREACASQVTRGTCYITLNVKRESNMSEFRINDAALEQVLSLVKKLETKVNIQPVNIDNILNIRGVLEMSEPEETEEETTRRRETLLKDFSKVLGNLTQSRREEGARLATIISSQVNQIDALVTAAQNAPARQPDFIKNRLKEMVAKLKEADSSLNEDRLHQEAVLLAAKADIEEELARLKSHIAAARDLLKSNDAVGRRLDFLTQEFNREANTLCSKANDNEISRIGLELKSIIDQMREQVQNVE